MFQSLLRKFFGDKSSRENKKLWPVVEVINAVAETLKSAGDEELRARCDGFRERIRQVRAETEEEWKDEPDEKVKLEAILDAEVEVLDAILPEVYAIVKETCRRHLGKEWQVCGRKLVWDMVPYDVQLIGGIVLHSRGENEKGKIAEMATGEGKTLVATLPVFLNSLTGRGVHLITVNDYLAQRDAEWMGPIYQFLGSSVGFILNQQPPHERFALYRKDIVYGTNNEFGFDYLRDNMSVRAEDQVQRPFHYAIVDEVDSVLIDEARTPLIISGPVSVSTHKFDEMKPRVDRVVREQTQLVNGMLADAEKILADENGDQYQVGIHVLRAFRGAPKNKRLAKILKEPGVTKLMRRVENDYMRDKRMGEIDEALLFAIEEKGHVIDLTDKGRTALAPEAPDMFVLPELSEALHDIETDEILSPEEKLKRRDKLQQNYSETSERIHNVNQLLRAYSLYEKDVEYVVSEGKVMIVDEFTGRLMHGRRYSDGLHQAIEAKEGVRIERETQTLATITLQNYFRLYPRLAGMTGTAMTEANEFFTIYKLDCLTIPTNRPVVRNDSEDQIYRTKREKYNAVIEEIVRMRESGRPALVGTISVDVSETLSRMLKRRGVTHNVLNAKYHKSEAEIIEFAGRSGAVTIATNMAGRGTDIKLGEGVAAAGGLHIIGTERHEARRIDLQLRGRSGRQGDPGSSTFYLSLEDDLMRLFGSERIAGIMDRLGAQEGEVITHRMVTHSIERAQKRVEARNFDIRKHLLEYDDVMNQQRTVIYDRRSHALTGKQIRSDIEQMLDEFIERVLEEYTDPNGYVESWDLDGMRERLFKVFLIDWNPRDEKFAELKHAELHPALLETATQALARRETQLGPELMEKLERYAILRVIDERWKEHLYEMDQIKEGIGLRAYGQKDPLIEYKKEAFNSFVAMLDRINEEALQFIFRAQVQIQEPMRRPAHQQLQESHAAPAGIGYGAGAPAQAQGPGAPTPQSQAPRAGKPQPIRVEKSVGRNDPCPCGSGKKYKKCHGAAE